MTRILDDETKVLEEKYIPNGNDGGEYFGIINKVKTISLRSGQVIDAIIINGTKNGGSGGGLSGELQLNSLDDIREIRVGTRTFDGSVVIGYLKIVLENNNEIHGGNESNSSVKTYIKGQDFTSILSISGRSGKFLDKLTITVSTAVLKPDTSLKKVRLLDNSFIFYFQGFFISKTNNLKAYINNINVEYSFDFQGGNLNISFYNVNVKDEIFKSLKNKNSIQLEFRIGNNVVHCFKEIKIIPLTLNIVKDVENVFIRADTDKVSIGYNKDKSNCYLFESIQSATKELPEIHYEFLIERSVFDDISLRYTPELPEQMFSVIENGELKKNTYFYLSDDKNYIEKKGEYLSIKDLQETSINIFSPNIKFHAECFFYTIFSRYAIFFNFFKIEKIKLIYNVVLSPIKIKSFQNKKLYGLFSENIYIYGSGENTCSIQQLAIPEFIIFVSGVIVDKSNFLSNLIGFLNDEILSNSNDNGLIWVSVNDPNCWRFLEQKIRTYYKDFKLTGSVNLNDDFNFLQLVSGQEISWKNGLLVSEKSASNRDRVSLNSFKVGGGGSIVELQTKSSSYEIITSGHLAGSICIPNHTILQENIFNNLCFETFSDSRPHLSVPIKFNKYKLHENSLFEFSHTLYFPYATPQFVFKNGTRIFSGYQTISGKKVVLIVDKEKYGLAGVCLEQAQAPSKNSLSLFGDFGIQIIDPVTLEVISGPEKIIFGSVLTEYMYIETGYRLRYTPNQPAFVTTDGSEVIFSQRVTTSWLSVLPPIGVVKNLYYYAMPQHAALFDYTPETINLKPSEMVIGPVFLNGRPLVFPALPLAFYGDNSDLRMFEKQSIATKRRQLINQNIPSELESTLNSDNADTVESITSKGLIIKWNKLRPQTWDEVIVGKLNDGEILKFTKFKDNFRQALLDDQCFIVAANSKEFCSEQDGVSASVGGWNFELGPTAWQSDDEQKNGQPGSLMIVKFCQDSAIIDLAEDAKRWTWQAVAKFDGSISPTQNKLRRMIKDAYQHQLEVRSGHDSKATVYDNFIRIIEDPNWTGILFLNVGVNSDSLPDEFKPFERGIDHKDFRLHHLGFNPSTFEIKNKKLELLPMTMFGLIHYQDTAPLSYTPNVGQHEASFKVKRLQAEIQQSEIINFNFSLLLSIPVMLGSLINLNRSRTGNTLTLEGNYQPNSYGKKSYVFHVAGAHQYLVEHSPIAAINITTVDLHAHNSCQGFQLILGGRLHFHEYSSFDLFSYGVSEDEVDEPNSKQNGYSNEDSGLTFSNYVLDFRDTNTDKMTVESNTADMKFDLHNQPRTQSFAASFPIRLVGLQSITDPNKSPKALGYVPVETPLPNGKLEANYYALIYELKIGDTGVLAGALPLTMNIMAAWSPQDGDRDETLYVGAKMPGLRSAIGGKLEFQKFLNMGFRRIEMSVETDPKTKVKNYSIALKHFELGVLSFNFPSGNMDMLLFADAANKGEIGWYASYDDV